MFRKEFVQLVVMFDFRVIDRSCMHEACTLELRLGEICEKSEIIKEFSRHVKMTKEI